MVEVPGQLLWLVKLDPRQLPHVIQSTHPDPANLSCLEWMLGDHANIPPDRGIFLPVSRRMHPDVCGFISRQIYEGRLTSQPDTTNQAVRGTGCAEAGAFWMPTGHGGNAQIAAEEVAAIWTTIEDSLARSGTDKEGTTRPLGPADIAPYNAQVDELQDTLPAAIRVGAVDKFQEERSSA